MMMMMTTKVNIGVCDIAKSSAIISYFFVVLTMCALTLSKTKQIVPTECTHLG